MVNLVVLACVLSVTTKIKGRQVFEEEKVRPKENPGYAYADRSFRSVKK